MAQSDILAKIPKEPTLRGRNGKSKPNIKNLFYQVLVNKPQIIHSQNEEDAIKNKKMARSDVSANLGERKNGQVQATLKLKTSTCALFSCICAIKISQNSLVSKSDKFLEPGLKLEKLWRN
jgi:hypothetical protein